MQQGSETLNLEQVLGILRRRAPVILLCCVLAAGAAYGLSKRQAKQYVATASLIFGNNSLGQEIAGLSSSGGSTLQAQQANSIELLRGGEIAAKTARLIGHGLTAEKVASSVSFAGSAAAGSANATGQGESDVVDVSVTSTSPGLAADIANTYVREFVAEQRNESRHDLSSALAVVNRQLAALTPQQRAGVDGLQLEDRSQTLRLLAELDYGSVQAGQEALAPVGPASPKTSKNTILGLLVGLFIGLGLAFLLERVAPRVRRPEGLEAIYRLPLLGTVPKSPALSRSPRDTAGRGAALPPAEAEAFNLIRAHLRFFNVDRDLRTILVASASRGEGKSTIARHLAEAATRLGSRVLLLEADLRQPMLAEQLHIQSGPGLADVLAGAIPVGEATQPVELEGIPGKGGTKRTLDVLVSGSVHPPNPAELLESDAMDAALERIKSAYDLVIVDTPPLTEVSDAFTLLTKVDGVVIVGRIGLSRRDAAERLRTVLVGSGAPLLGVIVNCSRSAARDAHPSPRQSSGALYSKYPGMADSAPSSPGDLVSSVKS